MRGEERVRRRAGDLIGPACAAIYLLLSTGWENLLWAFQMSFLGSVACGLAMLVALDSPHSRLRIPLATAMLIGSQMFSGVGVVFGIAATVMLVATNGRRRELAWLVPVATVFAAWFLLYARTGAQATSSAAAHPCGPPILALPLTAAGATARIV